VFELDNSLAVIAPAAGQGTVRRAFAVDRERILEEPRIVQTLPAGPVVSLRGDWPRKARIVVDVDPAGHHCSRSFNWNGSTWTEDPCDAACCLEGRGPLRWYEPVPGGLRHYRTPWVGGRTLWETYEHGAERSTFYDDHNGKARAKIQRSRCSDGVASRVRGRFSGRALPSGAVVGVGPDCQTDVVSVEHWAPGAATSIVSPLPGSPKGVITNPLFAAPTVGFVVHGRDDLYVSFEEDTGATLSRPYVAHFDGTTWSHLAFAEPGQLQALHVLNDGSVCMATHDFKRWRLWHHPGARRSGDWTDETPSGVFTAGGEDFYSTYEDPDHRLWFLGIDAVGVRTDGGWTTYRMPPADPSQGSMPLVRPQAIRHPPWPELVVSAFDERRFLLLRTAVRPAGPLR